MSFQFYYFSGYYTAIILCLLYITFTKFKKIQHESKNFTDHAAIYSTEYALPRNDLFERIFKYPKYSVVPVRSGHRNHSGFIFFGSPAIVFSGTRNPRPATFSQRSTDFQFARKLHPDHRSGDLSLIHISEPTRLGMISYAV